MAQFSVYQNNNPNSNRLFPLLLDIQTDLLDELRTTVVVPLTQYESSKAKSLQKLTPCLHIDGTDYLMMTPQLAGIARKELGKEICNLSTARTDIINALDFLLMGI
jgi:toxin CcdB